MKYLTLTLPGQTQPLPTPEGLNSNLNTAGGLISGLINIFFSIAIFMAFIYLIWGSFQYILASGKKEELAKARSRITWALVGLVVIFASYLIVKFATELLPRKGFLPL